ncbi:Gfo/Idh/MocA family protein [Runella sp.]|uniref:Gfo/Idh/MocA family protein n=1 Tax=Runella sp. TaxID=1960881 RepID=UPI003D14072E
MNLQLRFLSLLLFLWASVASAKPLRLGIAGFTHDHVHQILRRPAQGDVEIVGVAEPNKELAMRYLKRYKMPESLWYPSLEAMIAATKPEAVCAFNSIYEHKEVVDICAPKGIHVMVEKPLAVNTAHAKAMIALAKKHKIQLLTNFETTWYSSHQQAYDLIHNQNALGDIRKVVVHDGHRGPKEIGCSQEFLSWLTDPVQNGGGAIIDFGCYGANLMTWLMKGERPLSVTAVTQQIKPDVYPKVDDEATFILTYPKAQAIIQASWNWPFDRKDMEIYGQKGYVVCDKTQQMHVRLGDGVKRDAPEEKREIPKLSAPYDEPFSYFAAVVKGEIKPEKDLSSLEINQIVVEILEAAVQSAKTGKPVKLQ